jgi:predicted membrane protein
MRYSPQGARFMWLALAVILILLWVGGFLLFHLAAFALHILLIVAAVALVIHLLSGRRAV